MRLPRYREILLVGPDSAAHKKKFKSVQGARLVLLRRTLRANPDIARMVRTLKVPRPEPPLNWTASKGLAWLEQYEDRIASLVSACPNLERVLSPTWSYDHSWKRLFHALSTRKNLKEMIWVEDAFLELHRDWPSLQTLSIHCRPGSSLAPHTLLSRTLTCLPSLRHLHLCNLSSDAFNDHNLLSLPSLQSLTLSHINGITSGGLSAFATRPNSVALRRLDLRHTPLTSLPALARILSNLPNLTSFSLVQTFQPVMPETDSFTLWMMPYLASASIVKLHWDITNSVGPNAADDILARSIEAGGFPSLTTLRTPKDPEGKFQALCRPVNQISRPSDRFGGGGGFGLVSSQTWSLPTSPVSPSSPIQPIQHSLTMMSLPSLSSHHSTPMASDLAAARLAAQARLEAAQEQTSNFRMQVNIIAAEDGRVAESFGIGNYLGTMGSRIGYHLEPDEGATDEAGGLLDVSDLAGDGGEMLGGTQQGCVGSWNTREGVVADRKEKEKWWHTERGRWREVVL
ncbi:hypothetical protein ESCO_004743 [Escovopsis weberi]|uniref:F-box protein n=1 Tax=Escovopsis weberi TaxID=150374 RepID=A0A0M8MZY7_ESCWE|nr:hypothetical protein ESCO_004743 [Escovopsis weberi]